MVTVADLAERYLKREMDNKEFSSELNALYHQQFNERKIKKILKLLEKEVLKFEKTRRIVAK